MGHSGSLPQLFPRLNIIVVSSNSGTYVARRGRNDKIRRLGHTAKSDNVLQAAFEMKEIQAGKQVRDISQQDPRSRLRHTWFHSKALVAMGEKPHPFVLNKFFPVGCCFPKSDWNQSLRHFQPTGPGFKCKTLLSSINLLVLSRECG